MAEECVVAIYDTVQSAEEAVHTLDRSDLPTEQASLVTSGLKDRPELVEELKMGDDSVHDAAIGAGLGGVLGLLTGLAVAAMVAPVGVVFVVGAMAGMLSATTGAFLGSIAGWGVHHEHIRHYEQLVKDGKVLVVVHGNPLDLAKADRILQETDAIEVHVHAKTSAEAPEIERA